METQQDLKLEDLAGIVRRRGRVIAVTAGAVFMASILLAALLPNEYEAYTELLVEPQTVSERLIEAGLEGSDLNSRLHIITTQILSRSRLSRIIDDLALYPEESEEMTREEVIDLMAENVRVEPVLPMLEQEILRRPQDVEINAFQIFFRYPSAKTAAGVANRLANDFRDQHLKERVQVSGDTAEFIDAELAPLADKIRDVEARIARVKAENAGHLPEDLVANQRLLERSIDSLRRAEREFAQARSEQAFYRQQALSVASLGSPGDPLSPARRLQLLELQLSEYRARGFTDKHPDVIAATVETQALRERIALEGEDAEKPISVAQLNAEAAGQRAALQARALAEEIHRLQAQIDDIEGRIAETPRVAELLDGLQREYQHLFASYQEFSQKQLEASVAANMERRQKGEQVRVLQFAFEPPEPVSPNRPLILVLGALFGLTLGFGVGFLLENLDPTFHDSRTLQAAVGMPVLAAIPGILLEADLLALRRRRLQTAVATGTLVSVLLLGAALGYLWVNGSSGAAPPSEAGSKATPMAERRG